ncbi:hypothetical protein WR30_26100 [Burkholderia contaminans FFH2055]|nr:hypothetical protein WR30_26100 [Burkholderia contaminans FFH2055]
MRKFSPPRLYRDERTALAVRFPPKDPIDCRLRNIEATSNLNFAETPLSLNGAEKRRGGSWHVHAGILYAND